jgi:N-acetylmuramoyl-L-alanine amidase
VTLAIGRKLKRIIDAEPGMRAMLTRDDDYYVPLAARVQKARRVEADLFVSIHADAFREAAARGSSVFALSERGATSSGREVARTVGERGRPHRGSEPGRQGSRCSRGHSSIFRKTAQISDSLKVGRHMLDSIGTINALHKGSVEQAGFAVLKAPDIPSILVETAFISNPDEELKLRSDRHQAKFAESMSDGIRRYFAANPPLARRLGPGPADERPPRSPC